MASEKVKDVPKEKIPDQVREPVRVHKDGQSTFDVILERNRLLQQSPKQAQVMQQKGDSGETRVARHEEQGERGKDRQSDEKEQERGKQKAKENRESGAVVDHRIVGKGGKRGSADSGGSGKDGQKWGFGRPMQKSNLQIKKGEFARAAEVAEAGSKFAAQLKAQAKTAHLSREFIQNIVNQVVRFIKSGLNKDGEHEIRLDLHERIFRGLQLRVALKRGKVSVHFNTSNAEVRELFKGSSEKIQKELEAKGISVADIKVT